MYVYMCMPNSDIKSLSLPYSVRLGWWLVLAMKATEPTVTWETADRHVYRDLLVPQ